MSLTLLALALVQGASLVGRAIVDAPIEAAQRSKSGTGYVFLLASPSGAIDTCKIRLADEYVPKDQSACKKFLKLRATPATDDSGAPLYGEFRVIFQWRRVGDVAVPVIAPDVTLTVQRLPASVNGTPTTYLLLDVQPDGRIACHVSNTSGSAALDKAACSAGASSANIGTIKNAQGEAVRAILGLSVAFAVR